MNARTNAKFYCQNNNCSTRNVQFVFFYFNSQFAACNAAHKSWSLSERAHLHLIIKLCENARYLQQDFFLYFSGIIDHAARRTISN